MVKLKGKQRRDQFYYRSKDEGYRSRAAFKLTHMDEKYKFLSSSRGILDLCAAPGGWMQVAVRRCPVGALVIGVDLNKIKPVHGAVDIMGDITDPATKTAIRRKMEASGVAAFDVVLHDGSPNLGGAWKAEATTQTSLVIDALKIATSMLSPKGTFLTKIFRSQDFNAILYCLKQLFEKVEITKPPASRVSSAEIYAVCLRYKAPAKIDPRLLDVKHLFQVSTEPPKVTDVLRPSKQKRNREGYEEGNTTLWKVGKASEFIASEAPLDFLGSINAISFDDSDSLPIKDSKFTTDEVKSICEDLFVVDKKSFKLLLKWRVHIRKELSPQNSQKATDVEAETVVDDDERLLMEMEELTDILDKKKRKEKKKVARRRAKDKHRKATGMQTAATDDCYGDQELFSLSTMKRKRELNAVESVELDQDDGNDDYADSDEELPNTVDSGDSSEELDNDEARQKYDEKLDEVLDEVYERYLTRKGKSYDRKRARRVDPDADEHLLEDEDADDDLAPMDEDSDDHNEPEDEEANPLLALDRRKPSKQQLVDQWFCQSVFADVATAVANTSDSEDEGVMNVPKAPKMEQKQKKKSKAKSSADSQDGEIEIVPAERLKEADDDSSSDESEDLDAHKKAEILACAKKMLRKKQREQILDDAYNRYTFDDDEAVLPSWFVHEEKAHCQPMKPITKEEVEAMKAQFREIDARPIKKIAEAKARKKRTAMKSLEKARKKAEAITEKNDLSEHTKRKMIDQVYRKAAPKRPKKEYVVAKKGVQVKAGKNKVLVDRRMKKDKRVAGSGKKGKGKGGRVKGKKGSKPGGAKSGKGRK